MRTVTSRRSGLALAGAVLLGPLSPCAAAAPPASRHVQAALVSEVESIRPGASFQAGLRLRMDPEWHTYWKNPGDSGLPTRLLWTLPAGFQAGPIEWPAPRTFTQGPVTSYGYAGEVLLPVTITPPAGLAPGTPVTLKARADWLECREACLPGRTELTLELPVRAEAPRPSPSAAAFAATRALLPQAATGWTFEARETADRFVLVARPPRGQTEVQKAYFFPEQGQVIDHAAPQALARVAGGFRLDMTPAPNAARPLGALEGVLVTEGPSGATAVRVAAKSTKEKP
jgi:DsbC/DsbD-like thiol-disulfide interchange protein